MDDLGHDLDRIAVATGFSGVVRVDRAGEVVIERAYGLAHRPLAVPNTIATRFSIASVTKGLTALTVLRLVEMGELDLETPVRRFLAGDLPLIDDRVTVEHLLAHRSGIGDYVDEEAIEDVRDFFLPVPVGRLTTTEDYLPLLAGLPPKAAPGERFTYCNSGYVVLALVAERAGDTAFPDLVAERVCHPAGMTATAFLRSDELPSDAAVGYLDPVGPRTNVHHLPVVGSGDGGAFATVGDLHRLWTAVSDGRVVSPGTWTRMVTPRSEDRGNRYGLGVWLGAGDERWLEGADAGVSSVTAHREVSGVTWTVLSNTTDGAWPLARHLRSSLGR